MSLSTLPQVSLISSWFVPPSNRWTESAELPALCHALEQQILFHDLYFLHPADLAWYARVAGRAAPPATSPLEFVAGLSRKELDSISCALTQYLADRFKGRLIGPRPRFTALATYWPSINSPDSDAAGQALPESSQRRLWSVQAVRNSLYLAMRLGCHRVEIVGGSALPDHGEIAQDPAAASRQRCQTLVQSLREVFTGKEADYLFKDRAALGRLPKLCMEIEPGVCFLLRDVASFKAMHQELKKKAPKIADQVLLNIDVAHMMLTEGDETRTGAEIQLAQLQKPGMRSLIGHMHISDHTRSHASDLSPGSYHFYSDFAPWLRLAIDLTQQKQQKNKKEKIHFSDIIAVEMEACADIHEAARAIGRTRRWVHNIAKPAPPPSGAPDSPAPPEPPPPLHEAQLSEGAIIVFDIGSSTECLTAHGTLEQGARLLEELVGTMCRSIHAGKGSAWSFTGDGIIAHFDLHHFLNDPAETADSAHHTCLRLAQVVREFVQQHQRDAHNLDTLTIRFGMHWGRIFVPTGGSLRFEAFGRDVVIACRACDFVSKIIEPATPVKERKNHSLGSMTVEFLNQLYPGHRSITDRGGILQHQENSIRLHGGVDLKGVGAQTLYSCVF